LLAVGALAFAAWQVLDVARGHLVEGRRALAFVSLAVWAVWVVALVRTVLIARSRKGAAQPSEAHARNARLKALAFAFWMVMAAQVLFAVAAAAGMSLPVLDAARLTIALAVAASTLAFNTYERRSA
jgi:hypothetical protein